MKRLMVKTTTTLGDAEIITEPLVMEWPVSAIVASLPGILANDCERVTIERHDGTIIVYEPHWKDNG